MNNPAEHSRENTAPSGVPKKNNGLERLGIIGFSTALAALTAAGCSKEKNISMTDAVSAVIEKQADSFKEEAKENMKDPQKRREAKRWAKAIDNNECETNLNERTVIYNKPQEEVNIQMTFTCGGVKSKVSMECNEIVWGTVDDPKYGNKVMPISCIPGWDITMETPLGAITMEDYYLKPFRK